uniref:Uncharacterized protein n=1 Tax=uncultured marine microorganism HF4000_009G21 TaxID=455515 RepID=B3T1B7_9ZZZZ|nr:hypothetical protein ALOHA_HF4000009G21ctg1g12 [uncultured marine microorganism HF4000_009G21]
MNCCRWRTLPCHCVTAKIRWAEYDRDVLPTRPLLHHHRRESSHRRREIPAPQRLPGFFLLNQQCLQKWRHPALRTLHGALHRRPIAGDRRVTNGLDRTAPMPWGKRCRRGGSASRHRQYLVTVTGTALQD